MNIYRLVFEKIDGTYRAYQVACANSQEASLYAVELEARDHDLAELKDHTLLSERSQEFDPSDPRTLSLEDF